MMKKIYFVLSTLFLIFSAQAQIINFPDANFKAKLLQASPSNNIALVYFWPPVNGQNSMNVKIDTNDDGEIEVAEAAVIHSLNVSNANISSLEGIENFSKIRSINCTYNQLTNIVLGATGSLETTQLTLNCSNNQLTNIDINGFSRPLFLFCENNNLTSLDFSNFTKALSLSCSANPLTSLEFGNYTKLEALNCCNTLLTSLNTSGNYQCEYFTCKNNPLLTALMIKDAVDIDADMGDMWYDFDFSQNPNLQYLCVSENRLTMAQAKLNTYGYTNCALNSYCNFNAGMPFYTIQGSNKLDLDNNGCDASDQPYPNLKLGITNGSIVGNIPISNGNYSTTITGGNHTVSPILENPTYFNVTPPSYWVSFPSQGPVYTQDFCIAPNGNHTDLEVTILGFNAVMPGTDSSYRIQIRNKGTTTQSGTVNFIFDDAVLDLISSNPVTDSQSLNNLSWNFTNLEPFEKTYINLTFNINSPTDIPSVNSGDVLNFVASVNSLEVDEMADDNTMTLNQNVVNSFDPNDKTCLEGDKITPEMVGKEVHYMIRFENTGTAEAKNIVVKDVIDTSKFDINSLITIASSHDVVTRFLSGSKVEFIFENINLPFDDANNDGYVAFKIKTKPTLVVGDSFSNNASIYFDYNFPIITNTATTTVALLANQDFNFVDYFKVYPVPAKDLLNMETTKAIKVSSIQIYNTLGQLVLTVPSAQQTKTIDVSSLKTGNYFMKINSDKGSSCAKFTKQ